MLATVPLSTFDMVALGLCGLFALRGAWKGFVWQAVRLVALFGALWGAAAWHGWLAPRLGSWFHFLPERSVPFVAWVTVFLALLVLGAYVAHMARGLIRSADLSGPDRLVGLALGAGMGLGLCTLLLLMGGAVLNGFNHRELLDDALKGSVTPPYMVKVADALGSWLPDGVRQVWDDARQAITSGS